MSRPSQWETKQLTELLRDQVLYEKASWELDELMGKLPDDSDEQLDYFCQQFELGNWFFEALQLNEIDLVDLLSELAGERRQEEAEAERDRADQERDLRQMQSPGWPL